MEANNEYEATITFTKNDPNTDVDYQIANLTDGGFLLAAGSGSFAEVAADDAEIDTFGVRLSPNGNVWIDDIVVYDAPPGPPPPPPTSAKDIWKLY